MCEGRTSDVLNMDISRDLLRKMRQQTPSTQLGGLVKVKRAVSKEFLTKKCYKKFGGEKIKVCQRPSGSDHPWGNCTVVKGRLLVMVVRKERRRDGGIVQEA